MQPSLFSPHELFIPEEAKEREVIVGIDEAGRGPVLGPMVYSAAFWVLDEDDEFSAMGFDDSKVVAMEKRSELFEALKATQRIGYIIVNLTPELISQCMLRRNPYNLNALSHDTAIYMVRTLQEAGVKVKEVKVDTVGPPEKYERKLTDEFRGKIKFAVRKKADSLFKVVSAASICAKVTRDHILEHWVFPEEAKGVTIQPEREFGCGYPSDSKTVNWLKSHFHPVFGFPSIVRFSWSTASNMIANLNGAEILWEEEDEEEDTAASSQGMSQRSILESLTQEEMRPRKRARYFRSNQFELVSNLNNL